MGEIAGYTAEEPIVMYPEVCVQRRHQLCRRYGGRLSSLGLWLHLLFFFTTLWARLFFRVFAGSVHKRWEVLPA